MSKLMKEALMNKDDTADILSTVRNTWSHNREMSYPEAVFHLNSLPLFWKSREVVYLACDYPENRVRSLKLNSEDVIGDDKSMMESLNTIKIDPETPILKICH